MSRQLLEEQQAPASNIHLDGDPDGCLLDESLESPPGGILRFSSLSHKRSLLPLSHLHASPHDAASIPMCLLTCIPTAGESYPPAASFSNPQPLNSTTVADQMSTATAISLGMSISFVLFLFAGLYILRHVKLQPAAPAKDTRQCQRHSHDHRVVGVMNPMVSAAGAAADVSTGGRATAPRAANPMDAPQIGGSRIGVAVETAEARSKRLMDEIVDRALAVRVQSRGHKRSRE